LNASGIADDMKDHLLIMLDRIHDRLKFIGQVVVVGRQAKRPRERLKAYVSMGNGMQRTDARMGLGAFGFRAGTSLAGLKRLPRGFDGMFHAAVSPIFAASQRCVAQR
jgi:hypothetical protein